MQGQHKAGGVGAKKRGRPRKVRSSADLGFKHHGVQPAAGIAAAQHDASAGVAVRKAPTRAKAAPLVELLPPLEGVEPTAEQRYEQGLDGPSDIIGTHGKPLKKRDLRNRRGRPHKVYEGNHNFFDHSYQPSKEQRDTVTIMVGMYVEKTTIARLICDGGLPMETFEKYFAHEIAHGKHEFLASVKGMLVRAAQGGSVRAMTYLLDRIGGPEFKPRGSDEDRRQMEIPVIASSDGAPRVTIFLPDNRRIANT